MNLGNSLFQARKRCGLSQEQAAEKLGVSRQTVSKWETGETLPDIRQSKQMALLYRLSLDELIDFDMDVQEIQQAIERTPADLEDKIDWAKAWGKRFPVLLAYRQKVDVEYYAKRLEVLLKELRQETGYSELDAFLVLKDILATVWKQKKQQAEA